jgi:HK97 family phage major capsid protein
MTRICRVINTNVNQVTFPRDSNTNNITTSPQYGTTFRPFMGETVNTTLSKIDTGPFTQLTIPVNTGTMFTDVSADFFADVAGISNYIQTEASKAFAAVVDNQVINGVTASTEAEGVISNSSVGITKTGSNNTLVASKVIDGFYALADQYATNLSWVMRRATHGKLVALNDSTNRSLFLGSADSGYTQGITPALMGQPIYFNGFVPASGASTPKSIVLGDFNEYILLLRQGFTVAIDEVSLAYANRVRIAVKYRFGGAVRDPRAFQIIQELV